ncbi:MAG: TetR/AcrR family transcriptional regulator [Cyanobacteria bacterium P01_H01_bin.26]
MTTKKINGRGRPRGFDLEVAVSVAMKLFHRYGYDGVGVAELSKTIGITAPSLYAAFGSKCQLFERALVHYAQSEGGWLPAALAVGDSLEASIANLLVQATEVYTANPKRPGCLVIDGTRNCTDDQAKALTAGFYQATRQLICDRITTSTADLTEAEVAALTDYVVMILVGLSGSARDGMTAQVLRTTAEIAAEGFNQRLQWYGHKGRS